MNEANDPSSAKPEESSAAEIPAYRDASTIRIDPVPVPPPSSAISETAPPPPRRKTVTVEQLKAEIARLDRGLAAVVLVLAFFLGSFLATNTDVWMHLATGRLISEGNYVWQSDPFAYTSAGTPWINHSWLADLLSYKIFNGLGGPDNSRGGAILVAGKAVSIALLAAALMLLRRRGQSPWLPAVFACLAVLVVSLRVLLQPICVSFLFLGLTLYLLHRTKADTEGRGGFAAFRLPLLGIVLLFGLWVNLDSWFVLGPVTVALFLAGEVLQKYLAPVRTGEDAPGPGYLTGVAVLLAAGLAVCLVNPYGFKAWVLPPELWVVFRDSPLRDDPMFRAYFHSALDSEFFMSRTQGLNASGIAYWTLMFAGIASFILNIKAWRWWRATVWMTFALLSLYLARLIPFFAVVAAPITALNFQDYAANRFGILPRTDGSWKLWSLGGRVVTLVGGLALVVAAWPGWLHYRAESTRWPRRVEWAVFVEPSLKKVAEELKALRQQGILEKDSRGFNYVPDIANYCAWFCPEEKGFFDYRIQLFPDDIAKAYLEGRRALENPKKFESDIVVQQTFDAKQFQINHVVLSRPLPSMTVGIIRKLLQDQQQWALLYMDGRSSIFGWKNPQQPYRSDPFRGKRFDPNAMAFGPASEKVPAEASDPPRPPSFWSTYMTSPGPHPLDTDQATMDMEYFLTMEAWPGSYLFAHEVASMAVASSSCFQGAGLGSVPWTLLDLRPLIQAYSRGPGSRTPAPQDLALAGIQQRGPAAPLVLAVRAARRAVATNPEDTDSYLVLAQAYLQLWNFQEGLWIHGSVGRFQTLRQIQTVTALQHALLLRPDPLTHRLLAETYRKMNYNDLSVDHWNECLRLLEAAGPSSNVPLETFDAQIDKLRKDVEKQESETKLAQNRDLFEVKTSNQPPLAKAQTALSLGLARQALEALPGLDSPDLKPEEVELEVWLLISMGRGDEVRSIANRVDEYNLMLAGALGNYEEADGRLGQMLTSLEEGTDLELLKVLRAQTVQGVIGPESLYGMKEIAGTVRTKADLIVLRGVLALEAGENAKAAKDFQQALDLGSGEKSSEASMGNASFDFATRTLATRYLKLLRAEGIR